MNLRILILYLSLGASIAAYGADSPLEDQLKTLELPGNQAPSVVTKEKLYVFQTRFLPLKNKSEMSLGFAQDFTGNDFFTTRQVTLGYRFHLNDRWSLGLAQSFVSNSLTSDGDRLLHVANVAPDMPYARQRSEMTVDYNVFYGKFRISADQVFYFDQYVGIGPGLMMLNTGDYGAGVVDLGFAFWLGQWGSARIGAKDYIYNEVSRSASGPSHNIHGHLDLAYIF